MSELIVSVSGVRGTIGGSLTPIEISRWISAFGNFIGGKKIAIGRDSRTSGMAIRNIVVGTLQMIGCDVIDLGVCPTPTVLLRSKKINADGSIVITASHNPIEWNGLEFAGPSGKILNREDRKKFYAVLDQNNFRFANWSDQGKIEIDQSAIDFHISEILNLDWIDLDRCRRRNLKVVIDAGNGAGSVISPKLCRELGCEVIAINCEPNGIFPRPSEPTPKALKRLCEVVKETRSEIGFAHDGDADRLAIVTGDGIALSSEYTYAIISDFILSRKKGDLVATVSTSRMIDDVAVRHGVKLHRTPVGVGFIVEKMSEISAVIGGEGTSGVIFGDLNFTTDGIASIAAIVQLLVNCDKKISEIVESVPSYSMKKEKIEVPSRKIADRVLEMAVDHFSDRDLDLSDGVKIILTDRWVNIRKSGTEPVIRVFGEAPTDRSASELVSSTIKILHNLMKQATDRN